VAVHTDRVADAQAFRLREEKTKVIKELEGVRARRGRTRAARTRAGVVSVAVVGYTNAGKSSLMTALCGEVRHLSFTPKPISCPVRILAPIRGS
jgi:50S ribosomal subunit-associated GTPase HflX